MRAKLLKYIRLWLVGFLGCCILFTTGALISEALEFLYQYWWSAVIAIFAIIIPLGLGRAIIDIFDLE